MISSKMLRLFTTAIVCMMPIMSPSASPASPISRVVSLLLFVLI